MNAPFTENYSYQDNLLTEYQKKHNNIVQIVTSTRTRDECGKIINVKEGTYILSNGIELIRIKIPNKVFQILGIYPHLGRYIKNFSPDLIFIHGLCSFIPKQAIKYKKSRSDMVVHIVADNHQDLGTTKVVGFPFYWVLKIHKLFWKKWIQNVDIVYGTTSWRVAFAKEYYGIPVEKLDTLIMGIDSDRLPSNPDKVKSIIRNELAIPADSFVFVTGGKLDRNKNTIEALRAFHKVENTNARFIVFGSINDEIKKDFDELVKGDSRIIYIGYVDSQKVQKYFLASDFGVFIGRHSVLWEEAIGCGLPCVFRRYEKHDHTEVCGNCICLEKANEEDVYQIMCEFASFSEEYLRMKAAAKIAAESFSYHSIAYKSVEWCK
jgi:glycosyltransferase involved in cell wall biosynthesis